MKKLDFDFDSLGKDDMTIDIRNMGFSEQETEYLRNANIVATIFFKVKQICQEVDNINETLAKFDLKQKCEHEWIAYKHTDGHLEPFCKKCQIFNSELKEIS